MGYHWPRLLCATFCVMAGPNALLAGWEEDYARAKRLCEQKYNTQILRVVISGNKITCWIEDTQSAYGARGNYLSTGGTSDNKPRGQVAK